MIANSRITGGGQTMRAFMSHSILAMSSFLLSCRSVMVMNVVMAGAGVASGVILARSLGPGPRGSFAAITLWPYAAAIIADAGLSYALAYHTATQPECRSQICTFALLVSAVAGSLLAVAAGLFLTLHSGASTELSQIFRLALVATPFLLAAGFDAHILLGSGHPIAFNSVRLCAALFYSLGIVAMWFGRSVSLWAFVSVFVAAQIITALFASYLVWHFLRPSFHIPTRSLCFDLLHYGFRSFASSIAMQVNLRLDQIFMTVMLPAADLGYYVVAVAVSSMLAPIFNAVATLTLSGVLSSAGMQPASSFALRQVIKSIVIAIPIAAAAILSAPVLVPLIFGGAFSAAVVSTQVLLVAATFQGMNAVQGNVLRGLGVPGKAAASEAIGAFMTVVLLMLFLSRFGIVAAAVISLIAYSFVTITELVMIVGFSRKNGASLDDVLPEMLT